MRIKLEQIYLVYTVFCYQITIKTIKMAFVKKYKLKKFYKALLTIK